MRLLSQAERSKRKIKFFPLRRGIEPRSPAWQAGILTTILTRTECVLEFYLCRSLPLNQQHPLRCQHKYTFRHAYTHNKRSRLFDYSNIRTDLSIPLLVCVFIFLDLFWGGGPILTMKTFFLNEMIIETLLHTGIYRDNWNSLFNKTTVELLIFVLMTVHWASAFSPPVNSDNLFSTLQIAITVEYIAKAPQHLTQSNAKHSPEKSFQTESINHGENQTSLSPLLLAKNYWRIAAFPLWYSDLSSVIFICVFWMSTILIAEIMSYYPISEIISNSHP